MTETRPTSRVADSVPRHVAVIMDGNGRWAGRRGLPRTEGHTEGEENLARLVRVAVRRNIGWLTVFGFCGYPSGQKLPTLQQVLDGEPPANSDPVRVFQGEKLVGGLAVEVKYGAGFDRVCPHPEATHFCSQCLHREQQ